MKRKILVVDIGGTHVKLLMSPRNQREFASGPRMRPEQMIARFGETVREWKFDVASIGFPARVRKGRITKEAKHLVKGFAGSVITCNGFPRALAKFNPAPPFSNCFWFFYIPPFPTRAG